MTYFTQVKKLVDIDIADDVLIHVVFEMNRYFDKEFTKKIKEIQKEKDIVLDTPSRKMLRKAFYYGSLFEVDSPYDISGIIYTDEDVEKVFEDCLNRLNTYDSEKIVKSMKQKINDLKNNVDSNSNVKEWLSNYDIRRKNKLYSFVSIKLNQELFEKSGYDENIIQEFILKTYKSLENYRHLAMIVEGEIFRANGECITWELLYKAGIYAENFIQFKEKYNPFHRDKQITKLSEFLETRNIADFESLASEFYKNISTGYKYEDCYVSDNQFTKILIYKKIELDNTKIPCPSCNTTIQSGNSYPEVFLKSWECKNPSCPDRSKSGRGKRFDEYGVYRYFKLVENDADNLISSEIYQSFRRDVFNNDNDYLEFLIKEYTFAKEKLFMYNSTPELKFNREIIILDIDSLDIVDNAITAYDKLPMVDFFKNIEERLNLKTGEKLFTDKIEIINGDSSVLLQEFKVGQIGTAITSPPYYNAREYSQWGNLLMYFVDMLINSKTVYNALVDGGYYLYNIGDIVSEDNIYVVSHMSKRRVQLGFLSSMIFEIAGYNLTGNIIWDKGEVQSKRNSTVNLVSGYVKCINCYEHVLVFRKGKYERLSNSVERISPVIKINNKGENTYKHTAPYPIELVELLKPYVKKDLYVLDPFLGSGTTLKWCNKQKLNGIGFELNDEYYALCKERVFNSEGE